MKKIIYLVVAMIIIPAVVIHFFYDYSIKTIISGFNSNQSRQLIRIKRSDDNIITMDLEEYLVGVVSSEMPVTFEKEALKAQTVAARTYAMKQIENNKDKDYDVTDDINTQVYQSLDELKNKWQDNYEENINKIKECVNETEGEYVTYNDQIIYAFFFSTSNGKTEDNKNVFGQDLPYLKIVDSSFDENETSNFLFVKEFTKEEFYNKLEINYSDTLTISDINKTESGRIYSLKVNNNEFKGRTFQSKLSLRSNDFEIKEENNKIVITTKGFGHGVGMSQYGANALAKQNKNYEEIIKYYYQGTKIKKL
jgi:stage II sporulation protein D